MTEIKFTLEKLEKLRKAYRIAAKAGEEQFVFEGHDFLTEYARHVIRDLKKQLTGKRFNY